MKPALALHRAVRWPKPVPTASYDDVRAAFVERVTASGCVRSVYQMGSVRAPGLSDLDLLFVCSEPVARDLAARANIHQDPTHAYVLMHSQFFLSEKAWREFSLLFWGSDMRHVWGERDEPDVLDPDLKGPLGLAFNIEMALSAISRLARFVSTEIDIPIRPTMAVLHGVRFNLELAQAYGVELPEAEPYVARIHALRRDWFELEREDAYAEFMELMRVALSLLAGVIDGLAPRVREAVGDGSGTIRALEANELQEFGDYPCSWRLRTNRVATAMPARLHGARFVSAHVAPVLSLRLPGPYANLFAIQADEFRRLGARDLARRVSASCPSGPDPLFERAMRRRARAVAELHRFGLENRLRHASFPIPLLWQRPFPPVARWRARVQALLGVGSSVAPAS